MIMVSMDFNTSGMSSMNPTTYFAGVRYKFWLYLIDSTYFQPL